MSEEVVREPWKKWIGMEFPPSKPIEIKQAKLKAYCEAVGDLRPEYIDESRPGGTVASPAFASVYLLGALGGAMALKDIIKDPTKILHAGQCYEYFSPVRPGDKLVNKGRIADIYKRGENLWIVFDVDSYNQHNQLATKTKITICVRPGGYITPEAQPKP